MKKRIETIMLFIYILITVLGVFFIFDVMAKFGYYKIAESALNVAKLTSVMLEINDEDIDELLEIEFDELLENSVNKQLEDTFEKAKLSNNIQYAYIIRKLEPDEIKYTADTDALAEFYEVSKGTKLDYIWLADYIVDKETREKAYSDPDYYRDIHRYTTVNEIDSKAYDRESFTVFINDDEWAKTITAYAPIYSTEGRYVGLLGIDIFVDDYYDYRHEMKIYAISMFVLLIILLIFVLTFRYIQDRNEISRDRLTGLHTRKYYEKYAMSKLKDLNKKDNSLTVMMIDIDEFKRYNDYYGHVRGDVILTTVCDTIKKNTNKVGGCSGRFGGEEFIVIVPNTTIEEGDLIAEQMRKDVEQLGITHENGTVNKIVTISIGIYTIKSSDKGMTFEQIVEAADVGLYSAKNNGRNRVVRNESKN